MNLSEIRLSKIMIFGPNNLISGQKPGLFLGKKSNVKNNNGGMCCFK